MYEKRMLPCVNLKFLHASLFHWEIIEDSAGQWFPSGLAAERPIDLRKGSRVQVARTVAGRQLFSKRLRQAQLPA
jgi:hypothetical protein